MPILRHILNIFISIIGIMLGEKDIFYYFNHNFKIDFIENGYGNNVFIDISQFSLFFKNSKVHGFN